MNRSLFLKELMLAALGCAMFFSQPSHAVTTGLEVGNEPKAVVLRGDLTVYCRDNQRGTEIARHNCRRLTLDPSEFSRFVTDPIDADYVALKAVHEDGSSRSKEGGFDGATGKSSSRFNLWISTLLQRPLLDMGKNEVTYVLKRGGTVVKRGSFTVNVTRGQDLRCRYDSIDSYDINDCRNSANVCDRYFRQNNWCE
jgi:hypothetical protein